MPAGQDSVGFVLEDLIHPIPPEGVLTSDAFWSQWRPERVVVTITLPDELNPQIRTFVFDVGARFDVIFEWSDAGVRVGLPTDVIDFIGEAVIPSWGRRYVPRSF
jgi:hypothetical protein